MSVSEKLSSEIEKSIDEMISETSNVEETTAEDISTAAATEKSDAVAVSDEEKVNADIAATNAAVDAKVAAGEEEAKEFADEAGAVSEEIAQETAMAAVSDSTLARAVNVGISVADARELSPGLLEQIIQGREAELDEVDNDVRKIQDSPDEKIDIFAGLPKLDPEVHDQEVIKAFDSFSDVLRKQNETIKELQDQQAQAAFNAHEENDAALAAAGSEVERFFDKQVKELGDDFSGALGTGAYKAMDRGSPQFAKREAIAGQMSVLLSGYEAQGLRAPPREEVFDIAARIVLKDEFQEVHEKKLSGELFSRSTQHIQRTGTQNETSTQTPEEEAAAAADALLASR